jgi:hypothetical protein
MDSGSPPSSDCPAGWADVGDLHFPGDGSCLLWLPLLRGMAALGLVLLGAQACVALLFVRALRRMGRNVGRAERAQCALAVVNSASWSAFAALRIWGEYEMFLIGFSTAAGFTQLVGIISFWSGLWVFIFRYINYITAKMTSGFADTNSTTWIRVHRLLRINTVITVAFVAPLGAICLGAVPEDVTLGARIGNITLGLSSAVNCCYFVPMLLLMVAEDLRHLANGIPGDPVSATALANATKLTRLARIMRFFIGPSLLLFYVAFGTITHLLPLIPYSVAYSTFVAGPQVVLFTFRVLWPDPKTVLSSSGSAMSRSKSVARSSTRTLRPFLSRASSHATSVAPAPQLSLNSLVASHASSLVASHASMAREAVNPSA